MHQEGQCAVRRTRQRTKKNKVRRGIKQNKAGEERK
jgi:hypothetical protein